MIPFEKAYSIALSAARPLPAEETPLAEARHRILAEEIRADMDMPPFAKAMVDGYACRRKDLGHPLACVETIPAGFEPRQTIREDQCAHIMTGSMVPDGADCVFMVEDSEIPETGIVHFTGEKTSDNIAARGQDVRKGDVLLEPGHRIEPPDMAVLAAMGYTQPRVSCRPSVGVVATGDELVEPGTKPAISQIRNSNAAQLCAQVEGMGARATYEGIALDNEKSLNGIIGRALTNNDVVLLSGGVSMGEFDLVPGILKQNGVEIQFEKVAVQPGKPTVFGYSDTTFCFGLPGNPVSTFVIFEVLVKPFLLKMMGHEYRPPTLRLPLAETVTRKVAERKLWVPVVLTEEGEVARTEYHGSAHINALNSAQGLIPFPVGVLEMEKGALVPVRLIRD